MANISVKDTYALIGKAAAYGVGNVTKQNGAVSFESVFSNQAGKNSNVDEKSAEKADSVSKNDGEGSALVNRDVRKSVLNEKTPVEIKPRDIESMDVQEWEKAMEVLGAAAAEVIQQLADVFDMTVEEVENLMADLGMEQLDVLQQQNLSELILAVAGVDGTEHLLTDETLYSKYQNIMEGLSTVLEQCGEELQLNTGTTEESGELSIETLVEVVTTEKTAVIEEATDNAQGQTTSQGNEKETLGNEHSDQGRTEGNLLLQNLKTDAFEPQMQQVSQTATSWNAETVDIMRQIMDHMRIHIKPDVSNLEMQLHPESLGTLHVNIASKDGIVTAQFVTQNETVKAAVESQLIQLKESFLEQGVKVEAIEVTVQTHQFEQNLEQGRGSQNGEPDKKNRMRRIRLDGNTSPEELEGLEEAEQLAAEMMVANGNTVDYTA